MGLLGEVGRALEAHERVVGDHRAAEHGCRRPVLLRAQAGQLRVVSVAAQRDPGPEADDEQQAARLDHGGHGVGAHRLGDAPQVQQRQRAEEHHGHAGGGQGHEHRQVVAAEGAGQPRTGDQAGGQHAEAGEEARERTEGAGGVMRGTAGRRVLGRKFRVGGGRQQREHQGHQHGRPHRTAGFGGDLAHQHVHAGAQDVAEHEQEQQPCGQCPLQRRFPAGGQVRSSHGALSARPAPS